MHIRYSGTGVACYCSVGFDDCLEEPKAERAKLWWDTRVRVSNTYVRNAGDIMGTIYKTPFKNQV
jgi:hypothetical protein